MAKGQNQRKETKKPNITDETGNGGKDGAVPDPEPEPETSTLKDKGKARETNESDPIAFSGERSVLYCTGIRSLFVYRRDSSTARVS